MSSCFVLLFVWYRLLVEMYWLLCCGQDIQVFAIYSVLDVSTDYLVIT